MEHLCTKAAIIFITAVKAFHVLPMDIHHSNKEPYKPLRVMRSTNNTGNFDQTIFNCYNTTCVLNEEFCNNDAKKCEKCRYEHGKCTTDRDCFKVCIEIKAQEICSGSEGSGETAGSPWWAYLISVIFIISIGFNVFFVIKTLHIHKRCERVKKKKSDNKPLDKGETSVMLPNSDQISDQLKQTTQTKELELCSQKTEQARVSEKLRGPIAQETVNQ